MADHREASHWAHWGTKQLVALVALATLLLAITACGDDDTSGASDSGDSEANAQLLGPEDQATGEPVRIGLVSDGATQAYDTSDEGRSAQATADFWNEHRGGVGGRPIEVVTCETGGDPAGGTDCGNQLVQDDVAAVIFNNSGVAEQAWEPLHQAGIPTMLYQAIGHALTTDDQSTFVLVNPLPTLFGLPVAVAQEDDADRVDFVAIDVPQAIDAFVSGAADRVMENAGLDYDLIRVPPGTPDMTSQMQEVVDNGAGVVHVLGNDAFCIAAFQGLAASGYEGKISAVSQCITDATRQAMSGGQLDGISVLSSVAIGATDDPTYQLYLAVMDAYGQDVRDTGNINAMGTYTVLSALATSLDGISGDITPQSVTATIKAMPEQDLPGGGGMAFRCGGSAMASQPAVCTNQWLRATLDAEGQPAHYDVEDSSDILEGL
jgi:branched-chain amino acid transport system substrate-binding protein